MSMALSGFEKISLRMIGHSCKYLISQLCVSGAKHKIMHIGPSSFMVVCNIIKALYNCGEHKSISEGIAHGTLRWMGQSSRQPH